MPLPSQNIRRIRRDDRDDENINVVGYLRDDDKPVAWTGDDEAPFVKILDSVTVTGTVTATIAQPVSTTVRPLTDATTDTLDWDDSAANEVQSTSKAAAGRAYQVYATNESGSDLFFQLHNVAGALVGAEVPVVTIRVPSQGTLFIDYRDFGKAFSTGITWAASTTEATFTAPGTGMWVNLGYK